MAFDINETESDSLFDDLDKEFDKMLHDSDDSVSTMRDPLNLFGLPHMFMNVSFLENLIIAYFELTKIDAISNFFIFTEYV